jgi:hypothetical protein
MAHNEFNKHEQTVQELQNRGFDPTFDVPTAEILGYDDGNNALRRIAVDANGKLETTSNPSTSVIDTNNTTTTPLGIGAVYTGTATDCTGYSNVTNTIYADVDSAASGMQFQFCSDSSFGANTDTHSFTLDFSEGPVRRFQFPVTARYFRIKYTNGGTGQGAFNVQNILHRGNVLTSIHRLGSETTVDRSAQLVKSLIMGETTAGGGGMVNVKVNPSGTLETNAEITEPLPAGTNNIGDVDIASSALPTGAATAANQTDKSQYTKLTDGITDVSIHAVGIDGHTNTLNAVATEGFNMNYNGSTWDRVRGDTTDGLLVNLGSNNDVTTQALDRTTDNVGVAHQTDVIMNDTTALTPKFKVINLSATGDLVALVAGKKIRVLALTVLSAGTVNITFRTGGSTAISGVMPLIANTGFVLPFNPVGWFETASGAKLDLLLSASIDVDGFLTYVEV